jgi:hypothetical protein
MSKLNTLAKSSLTVEPRVQNITEEVGLIGSSSIETLDEKLRRNLIKIDKDGVFTRDIYFNVIENKEAFPVRAGQTNPLRKRTVEELNRAIKDQAINDERKIKKLQDYQRFIEENAQFENKEIVEENPFTSIEPYFQPNHNSLGPTLPKLSNIKWTRESKFIPQRTNRAIL